MTTLIILTVINIVLAWFFYYRIGKQSVINDLIKAYKESMQGQREPADNHQVPPKSDRRTLVTERR